MATHDLVRQVLAEDLLDEAIERYGAAVQLAGSSEPLRGRAVHGYANAVVLLCRRERQMNSKLTPAEADGLEVVATGRLDKAESLLREGLTRGVGLPFALQLVDVLMADWGLRARPRTLVEALTVARESIRQASVLNDAAGTAGLTGEDAQVLHADTRFALAQVLAARPPDPSEPDAAEAAAEAFRSACRSSGGLDYTMSRGIAHEWGQWALLRGRWNDVIEAFGHVESQLTNAGHAGLRPDGLLHELLSMNSVVTSSGVTAIVTDLAFARGMAGRPEEAIEGLEAARGMVWAAALSRPRTSRSDLAWLRPAVADLTGRMPDATLVFLVPGSVAGVALVARHGEATRTELLPELTSAAVELHLGMFFGALKARRGRTEDREVPVVGDEGLETWTPQTRLEVSTSWLWNAVMRRVMAHAVGSRRVVLVPTGLLVAAPLHAAWRSEPGGRRRYALDDADIVYLPMATMAPSSSAESISTQSGILVVQEPWPVSAPRLDMAESEAAAVARTFPNATVLPHEQATQEGVLEALTAHPLAHLICHGRGDAASPLDSHLLMSNDQRLRVADLLERDLSGLRLAVLSACESAETSTYMPEAAVSLPAALLSAGAGGVLGTLWEADDRVTALMMAAFYRNLAGRAGSPADPAHALREAQTWVRDSTNAMKREAFPDLVRPPATSSEGAMALWGAARTPLVQWAGFVYSGL
ncbi:CHAT domain-containing protein [Streptomyces shaanxiensis]|uniref:CHAT domain-containing protein n=1 Tax=Streptomyces shaanxiensis TaxID=653357 RepID=A0ABP7UET0_9ACTN